MVVGHLAVVKHFLALGQLAQRQHGSRQIGIRHHGLHDARNLRIDVVAQVSGIDTWIGGEFLLIEALDEVQCHLG